MNLIAALERFERDYNLTDGTDYSRVTMSAEAWTTLLSKVNDVTEALDDMSLVSEFNTRAQALEDQMDATDGSIKLFKGYLSLLNGVNSYSDATLAQAYATYKTDTEYTDNDTKVSEAITALDEAFLAYAANQQSNFEAGADHFLGENLDFERAQLNRYQKVIYSNEIIHAFAIICSRSDIYNRRIIRLCGGRKEIELKFDV